MKKLALLFPGQGAQSVGMGKQLYDQFDIAKHVFEEANDILGYDLKNICFNGRISELSQSDNIQLAILTTSYAAFKVFMKELGVLPHICAGHSIGEYTALVSSGAMKFQDAIKVVQKRGIFAQKLANEKGGAMTIINDFDTSLLSNLCLKHSTVDEKVFVSCYNSRHQAAISGHQEAVLRVEDSVVQMGGNIMPLMMSAPFHCELMAELGQVLYEELKNFKFHEFKCSVVSNVTAKPYESIDDIPNYLMKQVASSVKWKESLNFIQQQGVELIVDIGPQALMSNLLKMEKFGVESFALDVKSDRDSLKQLVDNNRGNLQSIISRCISTAYTTKNYNKEIDYEHFFLEPYKRMVNIHKQLSLKDPSNIEVNNEEVVSLLKQILEAKKVPENTREKRLNEIYYYLELVD